MEEDINYQSQLLLEGEPFDGIPYEELCRRADGLPPSTDYVCVDTRTFYEKYDFFCNIAILSVVLFVIDLFI